jgi:tetratricopeptide (TPR) repeat protein
VPWVPVAGAVVSLVFLLWGAAVQGGLVRIFPVSSLEVRPSFTTTFDVVRASHGDSVGRFLAGTGPDTFFKEWAMYKPTEVNRSQFWNLDFTVGYSTFTTALGTVGVLGVLSWCIPLALVLLAFMRVVRRRQVLSAEETVLASSLTLAVVYLWGSMLFYVPSQNMLVLAFVLAGAAFALTTKEAAAEPTAPHVQKVRIFKILLGLCVLLVVVLAFYIGRRYMLEMRVNQGLLALQQGQMADALTLADKAIATEKTADALQFGILAGTQALTQIAQATSTPSEETQKQFAAEAQATIAVGQQAVTLFPGDYRSYFAFGRVYDLLNSLGVQGAYDNAKALYASAAQHNPSSPEIPLTLARLENAHSNKQGTTDALRQSLTLKADYTDAILFAVQLYVADKDINNAIVAAKAAVSSAPGIASIWFQLGLLYYSANDTANAAVALEEAIKLEPAYANAKYFLGLSYAAQKKTADAIAQFKDLEQSNPDNQEVKLILSNLEQGKAPFEGATPPVTPTPQNRTTAPISQ